MIRFLCPGCDKKLAVPDDKGGKVGACPTCKTRFQIPGAAPPDDDVETGVTADPPLKRRPPRSDDDEAPVRRRRTAPNDLVDEPPRRRRSEVSDDDDDDDIPDAEAARPRKKKKKKRRRSESGGGLPLGLDAYSLAMIGIFMIGLPLVGISFVFPPVSLLAMGIGWLASLVGGVWFLIVAFQDDSTQGILCLVVPAYSLVYLFLNWGETWRPFSLQMAGILISVLSMCCNGDFVAGFQDGLSGN